MEFLEAVEADRPHSHVYADTSFQVQVSASAVTLFEPSCDEASSKRRR
jgi:hypothetical protein